MNPTPDELKTLIQHHISELDGQFGCKGTTKDSLLWKSQRIVELIGMLPEGFPTSEPTREVFR